MTAQRCHFSAPLRVAKMISLLRASVSSTAKQSGYLFLSLEQMFEGSNIAKVEKHRDGRKLGCDVGAYGWDGGSFLRSRSLPQSFLCRLPRSCL